MLNQSKIYLAEMDRTLHNEKYQYLSDTICGFSMAELKYQEDWCFPWQKGKMPIEFVELGGTKVIEKDATGRELSWCYFGEFSQFIDDLPNKVSNHRLKKIARAMKAFVDKDSENFVVVRAWY